MGRINVLGFDVANLIAAGEVVDRPSSVVKELIENSVDAGATSLTIEIKNGGKAFMRITDNGCGIEFSDLPVAILRHATSKIQTATDLESIMTFGFRGEALAAISSVSRVRIMSKTKDSEMGGFLECHGGEVITHIKSGCSDGTTIIVEDLFYNVPARKKFLKSDKSETGTITAIVEKVAMSKPEISFRYIVDGEVKFVTAGDGVLSNAIYAILGRDVAKKTIKVQRSEGGITVEGFISSPELVRGNRNLENFYINSRYVKSQTMCAALEQAFMSYIPSDKYPFCVLNLKIDPSLVDVNVHPAKLEVKFSNENTVFSAVYYAVRTALDTSIKRPELYNEPKKPIEPLHMAQFPVRDNDAPKPQKIVFDTNSNIGTLRQNATLDYSGAPKAPQPMPEIKPYTAKIFEQVEKNVTSAPTEPQPQITPEPSTYSEPIPTIQKPQVAKTEQRLIVPDYKIIGEAFNSYVIVELGEIMYLIDKHAAHERILFEELKKKTKSASPSSQMLLVPIKTHLTSEESAALSDWSEEIRKTGFSFEINGSEVSIFEIPSEIEQRAATDMLVTLVTRLIRGEGDAQKTRDEFFEQALYQASCKAAIKAGRIYDSAHIKWICDRVLALENIKYCPHGRPIAFEITKHFLEKQFERIK